MAVFSAKNINKYRKKISQLEKRDTTCPKCKKKSNLMHPLVWVLSYCSKCKLYWMYE